MRVSWCDDLYHHQGKALLPEVLRLEVPVLQLDHDAASDDKGAGLGKTPPRPHRQDLPAGEGKASTQFQHEIRDVFHQRVFDLHDEDVWRPIVLDGFWGIPESLLAGFKLIQ